MVREINQHEFFFDKRHEDWWKKILSNEISLTFLEKTFKKMRKDYFYVLINV